MTPANDNRYGPAHLRRALVEDVLSLAVVITFIGCVIVIAVGAR